MNIHYKLVEACENGDLPAAKECIEHGANVHAVNDLALRCAANNGHSDVVKYLIKHGANIHAVGDWALRYAAENGHLQVVNFLRQVASDKYKCHNCIIRSTCLELCEGFRQYQIFPAG